MSGVGSRTLRWDLRGICRGVNESGNLVGSCVDNRRSK